jgi:copper chaperone
MVRFKITPDINVIRRSFRNEEGNSMQHVLTVQGMTCGHCEAAVTNAIKIIDPSATVVIDRANERVDVQSEMAVDAFSAAIAEEGYAVKKAGGGCGGKCSCG